MPKLNKEQKAALKQLHNDYIGKGAEQSILDKLENMVKTDPIGHLSARTVNFASRILGVDVTPELSDDAELNTAEMFKYQGIVAHIDAKVENAELFYMYETRSPSDVRYYERLMQAKYILGHCWNINDYWRSKTKRQLDSIRMQGIAPNYAAIQTMSDLELKALALKCKEQGLTVEDVLVNNSVDVRTIAGSYNRVD